MTWTTSGGGRRRRASRVRGRSAVRHLTTTIAEGHMMDERDDLARGVAKYPKIDEDDVEGHGPKAPRAIR